MLREVPLASNATEFDISGHETLVNLIPKRSDGGKYKYTLIGTPGLDLYLVSPSGPIRQFFKSKGRCFAVSSSKFYEIKAGGKYVELGAVSLTGDRVSMASNGIQVVAVDGLRGFYYDTKVGTVAQITATGFYPSNTVTFQDGYLIFTRSDTGQFFISDLYSVSFDASDFAVAEGLPDNLVAVISDHREAFLFGTESTEVWFDSGDADFPFERNQGAFIEKGCAAPYSVVKQDNTLFFVGSDLIVYKMEGYVPKRVSNHKVEEELKGVNLDGTFGYSYQNNGQLFYILTITGSDKTFSYNIDTNTWSIRSSYDGQRHLSNCAVYFDNKTLVADYRNGNVYSYNENTYTDHDLPLVREMILPTINVGRKYTSISSFELDMKTGVGTANGQGEDPTAEMRYSKDGGETWSNWRTATIGKMGKYKTRCKWNRLGAARQFVIHVRISDPVQIDIGGAWVGLS